MIDASLFSSFAIVCALCLLIVLFAWFLRGMDKLIKRLDSLFAEERSRSRLIDAMTKEIELTKQDLVDSRYASRYLFKLLRKDPRFSKITETDDLAGKVPAWVTRK